MTEVLPLEFADGRTEIPDWSNRKGRCGLFIAMNRFQVVKGSEAEFEGVWRNREVFINKEKGFLEFHLLRGPEHEDHTLYASHTIWASHEDFVAWTKSQAFRDAHKNAGQNKALYLGAPAFEGFGVVQTVTR